MTQKEVWDSYKAPDSLEDCVKLLFEILDAKEINDDGNRTFNPTYISSCRVWDTHRLGILLPKMKELANK